MARVVWSVCLCSIYGGSWFVLHSCSATVTCTNHDPTYSYGTHTSLSVLPDKSPLLAPARDSKRSGQFSLSSNNGTLPSQQEFFVYPSSCQDTQPVRWWHLQKKHLLWFWGHMSLSINCVLVFFVEWGGSMCSLLTGAAPSTTISGEEKYSTGKSVY